MSELSFNEQMAMEYLLGRLSEEETERFDEMSIIDVNFAAMLKDAENSLIDQYVRSELPENLRERFESHYLLTLKRRKEVKFAKTFLEVLSKPSFEESPSKTVAVKSRSFAFGVFRSPLQWGLAAVSLFLLFTAGYLIFENMNLRNEIMRAKAEQSFLKIREQELERELVKQKSFDGKKNDELARVRERLKGLEQQLAGNDQSEVKLIAFNLSPQSRGIRKIRSLLVPPKIESVTFNLDLEANEYSAYTVRLKNSPTNEVLWQSSKIKPSAKSVKFTLPANLLKKQDYLFELSGILADGTPEVASIYAFRIVTK